MLDWTKQVFKFMGLGRYRAAPSTLLDGEAGEVLLDNQGRPRVVFEGRGPTGYTRTGASLQHRAVIKASAGSLLEIYGFNSDDTTAFALQIFDKATSPVDDDLPLVSIYLKPGDNFSFSPASPLVFVNGIAWALSTTPTKYTSGATAKAWVAAAYL